MKPKRISKGAYERMTTKYVNLPAPYEKMIVLDPDCPKSARKSRLTRLRGS